MSATQTESPRRSSVIEGLPASGIRAIFEEAKRLEATGARVIRFDVGRPDFAPPPFVVEATKRALDEGYTTYVSNRGIPELLDAITEKLETENGVSYDPAREVIVTAGASEAVAVAMLGVLEPGAEVLVPQPLWPHYTCCATIAGGTPVPVPLSADDGFAITAEHLERFVTPRTRMIVFCSPVNPTGVAYDRATQEAVLAVAQRHDLLVLADEIYEHFAFDAPAPCFASLPGARERTILINGFSKAFGMTGWRLGYLAAPAELSAHLNKPHQYLTVCATAFAQRGAVAAYRHPDRHAYVQEQIGSLRERRDIVREKLVASGAGALTCTDPGGAFYAFPGLPAHAGDGSAFALRLLRERHVAAVPGAVFGPGSERFLRLSYGSCPADDLREGLDRLIELCSA